MSPTLLQEGPKGNTRLMILNIDLKTHGQGVGPIGKWGKFINPKSKEVMDRQYQWQQVRVSVRRGQELVSHLILVNRDL